MNRTCHSSIMALLVASWAFCAPRTGHAQALRSDSVLEPQQTIHVSLEGSETPPDGKGVVVQDLPFSSGLRDPGDISLTGLWSGRVLTFGIPETWRLARNPQLNLEVMRSEQLIPEISSITTWLDQQPIHTFLLDGPVNGTWPETIDLPVGNGLHTIQFNAYHRSWLPCELAEHPGLWSRLMADSFLRVTYTRIPPVLRLSRWPFPFLDPLDPNPARVVIVVPPKPDQEMLGAAATLAAAIGHDAGSQRLSLRIFEGLLADAPAGHAIVLGQPSQWPMDPDVLEALAMSKDPEVMRLAREPVTDGVGTLILAPRPGDPLSAMLLVTGGDGSVIGDLATILASHPLYGLPSGSVERITRFEDSHPLGSRLWNNTAPPDATFTLTDIGSSDQTASGFRGGSVYIDLWRIPDDLPAKGLISLHLVYSHAAQASLENSRIDVLVNGVPVGGTALDHEADLSQQGLDLELPAHMLTPGTQIEVRFDLVGTEEPVCLGETHDELWGTVHATSSVVYPRVLASPRPNDLSLLRYGGYPFTLPPDLSQTIFVVPADPTPADLQILAWLSGEFGRVARGNQLHLEVRKGLPGTGDTDRDMVVIDSGPRPDLASKLGLLDSMWLRKDDVALDLHLGDGGSVRMDQKPWVAWIEQVPLPGAASRSALVVWAADPGPFLRVGRCPDHRPLFDRLSGRVTRIASCEDLSSVASDRPLEPVATPIAEASSATRRLRTALPFVFLGVALFVVGFFVLLIPWRRRGLPKEGR